MKIEYKPDTLMYTIDMAINADTYKNINRIELTKEEYEDMRYQLGRILRFPTDGYTDSNRYRGIAIEVVG